MGSGKRFNYKINNIGGKCYEIYIQSASRSVQK